MDFKIYDCSCFFKRGEKSRNYCIYNRKRGSGHAETHQKSIKNQSKIDAGKSDAKMKETDAKMEPKWEPKLIKH